MCCGVFSSKARWIVVTEDAKEKADEVPDTNEDTVVTPVAGLGNELCVEDRRTEGQDGQYNKSNVLATILHWNNLTSSGESDELIEASTDTRESITSYAKSVIVQLHRFVATCR